MLDFYVLGIYYFIIWIFRNYNIQFCGIIFLKDDLISDFIAAL